MNQIEKWIKIDWIPNLRGAYEISSQGNVRRTALIWHDRFSDEYKVIHKTRDIKTFDNGHGYLYVALVVDTENGRKRQNFYVHRLVAEGFIPNPNNKTDINHKNFVRTDNRVTNLEWCTFLENCKYSKTMDNRLKPHYPIQKKRKKIHEEQTDNSLFDNAENKKTC